MKKYILLLLYLFIASLNFNLILKQLNLITGGTQGLALILNKLTKTKPYIIILIINSITIFIGYFTLKKETIASAVISSFIYPIFIKLTNIIPTLVIIKEKTLTFTIIAGIIYGITTGLIYKTNFSSGGITIINLIINKYLKINISLINMIINSIIIIFSYFIFGIKNLFLSITVTIIGSFTINFFIKKKI